MLLLQLLEMPRALHVAMFEVLGRESVATLPLGSVDHQQAVIVGIDPEQLDIRDGQDVEEMSL